MALGDNLNKDDRNLDNALPRLSELGGIPGQGTLTVVRGRDKEIVEVLGTWVLSDEQPSLDTSSLDRACEAGESVSYRGELDDPEYPERNEVEVKVKMISFEAYEFNQQQYEGENATEKVLYRFTVEGSLPYL